MVVFFVVNKIIFSDAQIGRAHRCAATGVEMRKGRGTNGSSIHSKILCNISAVGV